MNTYFAEIIEAVMSHNIVSSHETQQPELHLTYYCRVSLKHAQQAELQTRV